MATVLTSGLVDKIKGKSQGSVWQYNQGGLIIRANKSTHRNSLGGANPFTATLPSIAQSWQTLSPSDRTTFSANAATYPVLTKFGATRTPSAYNLFTKLNARLIAVGAAPITTCTAYSAPTSLVGITLSSSSHTNISITIPTAIAAGEVLVFAATPYMSPGRATPIGYWRTILIANDSPAVVYSVTYEMTYNYGAPMAGRQVHFRVCAINTATGCFTPYYILTGQLS
jgi:hypothetical protein